MGCDFMALFAERIDIVPVYSAVTIAGELP
jgi:hypothetical protein